MQLRVCCICGDFIEDGDEVFLTYRFSEFPAHCKCALEWGEVIEEFDREDEEED